MKTKSLSNRKSTRDGKKLETKEMKTKPLTSFFSTQATLQLPNHVRELIELVKPKKVCVQHVYNTSD